MSIVTTHPETVNRFPSGNISQNNKTSLKEFFEKRINRAQSESSEFTSEPLDLQEQQKAKRQTTATIKKAESALFACVGLDSDNRDFLFTLYGLSNGQKIFNCSYAEMHKHLFKSDDSELNENRELTEPARQKIRRRIDHLENQQSEIGITFAEIQRGSKEGNTKRPTQITLYLIEHVEDILQRVPQKNLYGKRLKAAMEQATREVVNTLRATMNINPISSKLKNSNPYKKIKDGWKRAAGNVKATIEQMKIQGYEDWAIRQEAIEILPPELISLIQNSRLDRAEPNPAVSELGETQGGGIDTYISCSEKVSISSGEGVKIDTLNCLQTSENESIENSEIGILHIPNVPETVSAITDIELFASVGAVEFDISLIGEVKLDKSRKLYEYTEKASLEQVRCSLVDEVFKDSEPLNVILRPRLIGAERRLIDLDDLNSEKLAKVKHLAFRVVETSPENYQAWLCVEGASESIERRLKRGIGSDVGANGATRIAGSLNVKESHRIQHGTYPTVRLNQAEPGRVVTVKDIAKLLAPTEKRPPCVSSNWLKSDDSPPPFPDYDLYVRNATKTRSDTDFAWTATALRRGIPIATVESELERLSQRAAGTSSKERTGYIKRTVQAAARKVGLL